MDSSSGGEEVYDSRAAWATDNLSSILNTSSFLSLPVSTVSLSSSTSHNRTPPSLFDPFSHPYNHDPVWPDPIQHQNYQNTLSAQLGTAGSGPSSRPNQPAAGPIKNPRKRTRASRRAPTTVLTTNTTNFRQMVQEFTGIPALPFPATSSPQFPNSGHLDLFEQPYRFCPAAQNVLNMNITNATPLISTIATPGTTNNTYSTPYNNNNQFLGFASTNSLQNQLLSNQSLMFGLSKSTQDNALGGIGITQDHINANLSAYLNDGKGILRENNRNGVLENNVIATRNEENLINSWNYSQGL